MVFRHPACWSLRRTVHEGGCFRNWCSDGIGLIERNHAQIRAIYRVILRRVT